MAKKLSPSQEASQPGVSRKTARNQDEGDLMAARARILERTTKVTVLDPTFCHDWIRARQERGLDQYDEVWEGVYVVPPLANNPHQDLATGLAGIAFLVVNLEGRGRAQARANVSDRRSDWERQARPLDGLTAYFFGY
jgi:hypothetical protein